jgi:hypothetical protein
MTTVYAQTPTHYPTGKDPVVFTPVNILVYIVFPLLLFAFVIVSRRRKKKKTSEGEAG